jgi:RND superfamily putative drug exporter
MQSEASLTSPFARLGAWIARHTRIVLVAFVIALVLAGSYGASVTQHLPSAGLEVPGSESFLAAEEAARHFGVGSADVLLLVRNTEGDVRDPFFGSLLIDALEPVLADPDVVGALTVYDTNQDTLVSRDGSETLVILSLDGDAAQKLRTFKRIEPLLREVPPPAELKVGGLVAFTLLVQDVAREDAARAELFALPLVALLTLLFFRSWVAALLPIAIGVFALAGASALIRFGAQFLDISIFAMSVGAFLGLGISIDYALLLVQRFREELVRGRPVPEAVAATYDTAGRAVWISGLTVGLSLAALIPVPLPVLRSVAIGGVLVVASALIAALGLLPALLAWLGPNVNRGGVGRALDHAAPSPFWRYVGEFSMRHPVFCVLLSLCVLGTIASPALRMKSALPDSHALARESEVRLLDEALSDPQRFDPGGASAIALVVTAPGPVLEPERLRVLRRYAKDLSTVTGVTGVRTPLLDLDPDALTPEEMERTMATEPMASELRRMVDGSSALLIADNEYPWRSPESAATVRALREVPRAGLDVKVGGATAQMNDMVQTLRDYAGVAVALVGGWNLLVLLVAFRSIVVPIKAVLMNVLSLSASYGVLVWVFQEGHGARLLGFEPLDGIDPTIPLVMFAVVFGLSMDYEVFLLSRIQEEWNRTGDNRESVIAGIGRTGRIITSAALILLVVVGAFAAGDLVYVKQIGVGIAAAIALDVTLVRALLVPATMQMLGDWNWWAPRWMRRRSVRGVARVPAAS